MRMFGRELLFGLGSERDELLKKGDMSKLTLCITQG